MLIQTRPLIHHSQFTTVTKKTKIRMVSTLYRQLRVKKNQEIPKFLPQWAQKTQQTIRKFFLIVHNVNFVLGERERDRYGDLTACL